MTTEGGEAKKRGAQAAREWYKQATIDQRVALAGCDFRYEDTLSELVADSYDVPESEDADYSWGFFKMVKGKVFNAILFADKVRQRDQPP